MENLQKGVNGVLWLIKDTQFWCKKITDLVGGGSLLQSKFLVKNMQCKTSCGIFLQGEVRGLAKRQ